MHLVIIVPSYREPLIREVVSRLLEEKVPKGFILDKIIVVASGYKELLKFKEKNVVVINEKYRTGKASAINLALKKAKYSDIVVLANGDALIKKDSIRKLLEPFVDPRVGMTAGRPIPINDDHHIIGFIVHLIWNLHHIISLENPKTGELVAFRNVIDEVSKETAVDEAYIECQIKKLNYEVRYVSDADVLIKGPENISDLIKQRKRIFIGHLHLKENKKYKVSTMNTRLIIKSLLKLIYKKFSKIHLIAFAVILETYIRLSAAFDFYIRKKNPFKWEVVRTAKIRSTDI